MLDLDHLSACVMLICNPDTAANAVAWFDLDQAGLTREEMEAVVAAGDWMGPTPLFDMAPDRSGKMWALMLDKAREATDGD